MSQAGFEHRSRLSTALQELHYREAISELQTRGANISEWDTEAIQNLPDRCFPEKPAVGTFFDKKHKLALPTPLLGHQTIGLWASFSLGSRVGLPAGVAARDYFVNIYSNPGRRLMFVIYPEQDSDLAPGVGWAYAVPDSPPFALRNEHTLETPGVDADSSNAETDINKIRGTYGDDAVEMLSEDTCRLLVNALGHLSINNHRAIHED